MKVLVLGASGATGKLVVMQLIERKIKSRILVRKSAVLPAEILENTLVEIVRGNINELDSSEISDLVHNCNAVISCLGHNISFKGLFGKPRYLVFDAVQSLCDAIKKIPNNKVKLLLMSTTAYANHLKGEKNSFAEKIIFSLLMLLLPPHRDNVKAADYLINEKSMKDDRIEWVAVRPDELINSDAVSTYDIVESPVRSPVFDAGKTSRINVSHFMAELVTDEELWRKWVFNTPVIYNK